MGTRGSQLALAQANTIKKLISERNEGLSVDVSIIKTTGDRRVEERFQDIGSKGLFTKELDDDLLAGKIDFAVHSMKDLPSELPLGLALSCVPIPEDCRDAFLSSSSFKMQDLPAGSKIGTSSVRRKALLRSVHPTLNAQEWRGNVENRVKKMEQSEVSGIFLAYAGLKRLGMDHLVTEILDPTLFIPAVGQGMLAIVTRKGDAKINSLLTSVHDEESFQSATIQRHFMHLMQGGCSVPLGCYLKVEANHAFLYGFLSDFNEEIRCKVSGSLSEGKALAIKLVDAMKAMGSEKMLATLKTKA